MPKQVAIVPFKYRAEVESLISRIERSAVGLAVLRCLQGGFSGYFKEGFDYPLHAGGNNDARLKGDDWDSYTSHLSYPEKFGLVFLSLSGQIEFIAGQAAAAETEQLGQIGDDALSPKPSKIGDAVRWRAGFKDQDKYDLSCASVVEIFKRPRVVNGQIVDCLVLTLLPNGCQDTIMTNLTSLVLLPKPKVEPVVEPVAESLPAMDAELPPNPPAEG